MQQTTADCIFVPGHRSGGFSGGETMEWNGPGGAGTHVQPQPQQALLWGKCVPIVWAIMPLSRSVWLKLRASLYEAQIGLGARLVSANPPPPRAPR